MLAERLRSIWRNQGTAVGCFVRIPAPAVPEICGRAGLDFVIIDMEHGPISVSVAEDLVRGAVVGCTVPIIRVPKLDPVMIQQALDTGCAGVLVPQVGSADDAGLIVRSAKYWPQGSRGVCRFVRAAGYSAVPREEYFRTANRDTLVIGLVEGEEGLRNLDRIVSTPGLDVVFVGPYDLSQSLGLTGQVAHPKVEEAMVRAIATIREAGLVAGTFVDTREAALKWKKAGVQFLAYEIDSGMLFKACEDRRKIGVECS